MGREMIFGLTPPERFAMGLRVALSRQLRRAGDERPSHLLEAVKAAGLILAVASLYLLMRFA